MRLLQAVRGLCQTTAGWWLLANCYGLLLLGHAMAEAAGATDISYFKRSNSAFGLIEATKILLVGIANEGAIEWKVCCSHTQLS